MWPSMQIWQCQIYNGTLKSVVCLSDLRVFAYMKLQRNYKNLIHFWAGWGFNTVVDRALPSLQEVSL